MTCIVSGGALNSTHSLTRHQCRYAIQFKIIIIITTTFHSVRVTNKPQSVNNAAYTFLVHTVVIQLLVLGIELHNRLGWTAFSGSLVQPFNDCHISPHIFQSRVFQSRVFYSRASSVPSTLNIAII